MGLNFFEDWSKLEVDIADELIAKKSEKRCLSVICPCCCECCCRRKCVVTSHVFSVFFGICATLLLIGFMIFVVGPTIRAETFKYTTCRTIKSELDLDRMIVCTCGGRRASCFSSYPCLNIDVIYTREDGTEVESKIFSTEHASTCSYNPTCSRVISNNIRDVERYYGKYGQIGYTFGCYYNPAKDSKEVIQDRSDKNFILPFWLIPTIIIAVCLIGFLLTYGTCGWRPAMYYDVPAFIMVLSQNLEDKKINRLIEFSPATRRRLVAENWPKNNPLFNVPPSPFGPSPTQQSSQKEGAEENLQMEPLTTTV